MSAKEKGTRVFILTMVAAFILSSLGFSALVIWTIAKGDNQDSQSADIRKQLQDQQMQNQPLQGYNSSQFDKNSVKKLKVEVLKQGNGKLANKNSTVKANYFGWTNDGKIFDSSNKGGVTTPAEFPLSGVIKGWTQGLNGVKAGSTVKLTIPADLAYGKTGRPPSIGPNEPLEFIVELQEVK